MEYLTALAREKEDKDSSDESAEADAASVDVTPVVSPEAYSNLMSYLSSPEITLACWDYLGYYAEEIIGLPVFNETQLETLKNTWQKQMLARS